jgi:hypothetical protein
MRSRKTVAETIRRKLNFAVTPPLRDQLLAHALQEQEQSCKTEPALKEPGIRGMIMKISLTRIAVAALIGTGVVAAAVGVQHRYHFFKTDESGRHTVMSEDGRKSWNFSQKTVSNPQQAVETAEEMDLLIQQGKKELVGAQETEVNGRLDHRLLQYRYTLSDGRTVTRVEDDPETGPGTLTREQQEEIRPLLDEVMGERFTMASSGANHMYVTDSGKEIPIREQVVQGRAMIFTKYPVTLADGTHVAKSIGHLSENSPLAAIVRGGDAAGAESSLNDLREIASLRKQNQRQLLAVSELNAHGEADMRVHVYRYQLSDGRTKDMKEDAGGKWFLSAAQRQEAIQARNAKSGQDLGTYEKDVEGRTFVFTRQRFVLSDGTELIWSSGKPKGNQ